VKPGPPRDAYEQLRKIFGSTSGFEALVSGNRVTLLHDGEQAFPAMLEAIAEAKREILLEMYWFASDEVGRQFADALTAKAEAGVTVRVIYDAIGSIQSDGRMFSRLRDAGCEVEQYNPIAPWRARFRVGVVNNRDHRKLLIVDRHVGFTGGVNLGGETTPSESKGRRSSRCATFSITVGAVSSNRRPRIDLDCGRPSTLVTGRAVGSGFSPTTTFGSAARSARLTSAGSRAPSGPSALPTVTSFPMDKSAACLGGPSPAAPKFA
jgi:hypothetical protein